MDYEGGKIIAKNFFFSVPFIEPSAVMVHGFTVEKLKVLSKGKVFSDFADEIANDFYQADTIIAHNISFDLSFLRQEFLEIGKPFRYKNEFCSMKTAVPVTCILRTNNKGYKYPKLTELCSHLNIFDNEITYFEDKFFAETTKNHDARFDTTALFMCVKTLIKNNETFANALGGKNASNG
jgi:DNA polymerase-3 subunit epsilon